VRFKSGWNCHISLLSPEDHSTLPSPKQSRQLDEKPELLLGKEIEDDVMEFSRLLPLLNFESTKILNPEVAANREISKYSSISNDSAMEARLIDQSMNSCMTDSSEQSATQMPFLLNRAKLPRRIKNIEPHIQNVENVPLLVSLFTDKRNKSIKFVVVQFLFRSSRFYKDFFTVFQF
jgi:hypothetical protein